MDDFGGTPISGNLHMGISLSFDVKQSWTCQFDGMIEKSQPLMVLGMVYGIGPWVYHIK